MEMLFRRSGHDQVTNGRAFATLDVIVRIEEYPTTALTGVAGPSGLLRETGRGNRFEGRRRPATII